MGFAIISTWKMSYAGLIAGYESLKGGANVKEAIRAAIHVVEDDESVDSVGYGALPNQDGVMEFDASYMDSETGRFGSVMALRGYAHPIDVAMGLSDRRLNCQLVGQGAAKFAQENGFATKEMLTDAARKRYLEEKGKKDGEEGILTLTDEGHDTVGVCAVRDGHIGVGVSTSGLFMKEEGRVGDSPIIGSGFYCEKGIGAAAATGVGEDILRGVLCYETIRLMGEGQSPVDACRGALSRFFTKMKEYGDEPRSIALIAISKDGQCGAATNADEFAFVYGCDGEDVEVHSALDNDPRPAYLPGEDM